MRHLLAQEKIFIEIRSMQIIYENEMYDDKNLVKLFKNTYEQLNIKRKMLRYYINVITYTIVPA